MKVKTLQNAVTLYIETTATKLIKNLKKRIRAIAGGTSASKTVSILIILTALAQTDKKPTLTSIASESVPHLRRGVIRDFKNILKTQRYWDDNRWRASEKKYTFETGSEIEFFSAGKGETLKGGRRDRLFLNECNHLTYNAYSQLETRTKELIFLDWNPDREFWFYDKLKNDKDVDFLTVTYKDNEALDENIVKTIEKRKGDKNWWRVYGEGKLGEAEGRIYTGWGFVDSVPEEARYLCTGLDFGYTNDETAGVDIYEYRGGFLFDEVLYRKKLLNSHIYTLLTSDGLDRIVLADSAEPKSIAELKLMGLVIHGAEKGKGSVLSGIDFIQSSKIWVTNRSVNVIKEYRNYMWTFDKLKDKRRNIPQDFLNHSMDAIRYGLSGRMQNLRDNRLKNNKLFFREQTSPI